MKSIKMLVLLVFVFPAIVSGGSMRCRDGYDLLLEGDSKMKVIECLGAPEYKDEEVQTVKNRSRTVGTETRIESWYYRIDGWSYQIRIMNGRVIDIVSLGRD